SSRRRIDSGIGTRAAFPPGEAARRVQACRLLSATRRGPWSMRRAKILRGTTPLLIAALFTMGTLVPFFLPALLPLPARIRGRVVPQRV
ncbi:MAG: hypothetical protein ACREKF_11640, partial [Candidatus Methylomirabilales bacterium]